MSRVMALAAAAALLLTGCGGAASSPSSGAAPAPSATAHPAPAQSPSAAPSSGSTASAPARFSIAYTSIATDLAPIWIASDTGLFKKYGLNVKVEYLNDSAAAAALLAGDVKFDITSSELLNPMVSGEFKGEYVGTLIDVLAMPLFALPSVKNMQGLAGKTVAITKPGSLTDTVLHVALAQAHMAASSVHKMDAGSQQAIIAAMKSGDVAAGTLASPNNIVAQKLGFHQIAEPKVPGLDGAIVTSDAFAQAQPQEVTDFLKAMAAAIHYAKTNEPGTLKIMQRHLKISSQSLLKGSYAFYEPFWQEGLGITAQSIKNGLVTVKNPAAKTANPHQFYTSRYLSQMAASGFFKQLNASKG